MNALPIFLLPFVTMGIPLLWGVWELTRARKASGLPDDGMIFSGMRRDRDAIGEREEVVRHSVSTATTHSEPRPETIRFPQATTETTRTLRSVPVDGVVR